MRQADQKVVGNFFSINSTYMYMDLCNIIQLALYIKWQTIYGSFTGENVCWALKHNVEVTNKLLFSNPGMTTTGTQPHW